MGTLIICVSNIVCFIIGAVVGQKVIKQEPIVQNPVKIIKQATDNREYRKEMDKFETMLANIDSYNGTGEGQKEV